MRLASAASLSSSPSSAPSSELQAEAEPGIYIYIYTQYIYIYIFLFFSFSFPLFLSFVFFFFFPLSFSFGFCLGNAPREVDTPNFVQRAGKLAQKRLVVGRHFFGRCELRSQGQTGRGGSSRRVLHSGMFQTGKSKGMTILGYSEMAILVVSKFLQMTGARNQQGKDAAKGSLQSKVYAYTGFPPLFPFTHLKGDV